MPGSWDPPVQRYTERLERYVNARDEINGINTVKIMEDIRSTIPEREEGWKELRFEDVPADTTEALAQDSSIGFDRNDFDQNVGGALAAWQIPFFRPLPDGPVKKFFKRVVRKLIRFVVDPLTQDCTNFNGSVARSLGLLRRYMRERDAAELHYEAEIARLNRRIRDLETRLDELEKHGA